MARPEDEIQKALVTYLRRFGVPGMVFFHIPNEGIRSRGQAGLQLALGLLPGAPDLCLIRQGKAYFLEVKANNGRTSIDQRAVLHNLHLAGAHTTVGFGLDDCLRILQAWGMFTPAFHRIAPAKAPPKRTRRATKPPGLFTARIGRRLPVILGA